MPELATKIPEKYLNWSSPTKRPTRSALDVNTILDKQAIGQEKRTSFTGIPSHGKIPQKLVIAPDYGNVSDVIGEDEQDGVVYGARFGNSKKKTYEMEDWSDMEPMGEGGEVQDMDDDMWDIPILGKEEKDEEWIAPVLLLKKKETVGSDAFNLELEVKPTSAEWKRHIVAYLKEYRLQVQKHSYLLIFGRAQNGQSPVSLRDEDRGESLVQKAQRAIVSRTEKKQPIHREEAELEGLAFLNEQLRFSQTGDTVVWASPPGPKDEGYGNYGFLYIGRVTKSSSGEASVAMQAIRIEKPILSEYNAALTEITGEEIAYEHADTFLARPKVVRQNFSDVEIDTLLQKHFDFTPNEEDRILADRVINKMESLLEDFVTVMQTGTREERIKAFYTVENYALQLKAQEKALAKNAENVIFMHKAMPFLRLANLVDKFGHRPPVVAGSCGSTDGKSSSNSLTSTSGSESLARGVFGEAEGFTCPKCLKPADGPVGDTCPNCGITKDEFIKEGGVAC